MRAFHFGTVGANAVAVALARGEMGELVAEHLFEKRGLGGFEIGRDADEVSLRVAAAEARVRPGFHSIGARWMSSGVFQGCSNPDFEAYGAEATKPLLVVEVAESSLRDDLGDKAALLCRGGNPGVLGGEPGRPSPRGVSRSW